MPAGDSDVGEVPSLDAQFRGSYAGSGESRATGLRLHPFIKVFSKVCNKVS